MERVNRQRFLKRAGAATGAAAFVGVPGIGKAVTDDDSASTCATPHAARSRFCMARVR